jgi:UDP-N-acetylglucosamine 2-epimerase
MRILLAMGTRPEIIKLGSVYAALQATRAETEVFWSGQHVELAEGLMELFDISVAHQAVGVAQEPGLAGKFALISRQIEDLLRRKTYDWVVVQGDTTTAAAAATAAFMNRVPVAHVEAGLRTGSIDSPWPEEFNRRVIALAASLHFPPTERARQNLLREGISDDRIAMVGNTVVDALLHVRDRNIEGYVPRNPEIAGLPSDKKLVLATLHRRENVGDPLRNIVSALRELGRDGDKLIVLPVHFNPAVRTQVMSMLGGEPNLRLLGPLQYADFVHLLSRAWTVVTDSGGVQEEAPTFGLPILIARESTERPEVVEAGFGSLVGSDERAIIEGVRRLTDGENPRRVPGVNPFGDGQASRRIAESLADETTRRSETPSAAA